MPGSENPVNTWESKFPEFIENKMKCSSYFDKRESHGQYGF